MVRGDSALSSNRTNGIPTAGSREGKCVNGVARENSRQNPYIKSRLLPRQRRTSHGCLHLKSCMSHCTGPPRDVFNRVARGKFHFRQTEERYASFSERAARITNFETRGEATVVGESRHSGQVACHPGQFRAIVRPHLPGLSPPDILPNLIHLYPHD